MSDIVRPRLRDLGVDLSEHLPTGPHNAITDVPGVRVGHVTLPPGSDRTIRTGVTAILPHRGNLYEENVHAAVYTLNGFGRATGFEQIRETGVIEAPILLTNTLSVGAVFDAAVRWMLLRNPRIGDDGPSVSVVVGECNDSYLNDMRGLHIQREHVWEAIDNAADGPVTEGAVGAGAGSACFQFKGGIGTASRVIPDDCGRYTVGALVQTNTGLRKQLRVLGARVGRHLVKDDDNLPGKPPKTPPGSIMIVIATDAPALPYQLARMARRAPFALGRVGSTCESGSGDFAIAFSTTPRLPAQPKQPHARLEVLMNDAKVLTALFTATVEAIEEAVLNALCKAETTVGRDGHTLRAIPIDRLKELLGLV